MDYQAFADKLLSRLDRLDRGQIESFVIRLTREFRVFEAVFDNQRDGVLLLDSAGRVALMNRAARRVLGVENGRRGVGESWRHLLRDEAFREIRAVLGRFEAEGKAVKEERVVVYGKRRETVEVSLTPLKVEADQAAQTLWVLHDVGGRRDEREEQERARYVEFMATLTAGLAHEIRNPLNSLGIHASLLEMGLKEGSDSPLTEEDLDRLGESARILTEEIGRLNRIVDQFLTAARPVKLDRRPTRIETVFEQVAHLLGPECRQRSIELVIEADPEVPAAPLDPAQMYQVVLNLAKNAMEAIGEDGKVALSSRVENDYMLVEVSDTGRGIAEEDRAKIFEPYYSTKKTGSGLGLMVVWRIVKAHGGAIAVDSRIGEGTTFSIALPLDSRPVRMLPGRTVVSSDLADDVLEPQAED